MIITVEHRYPTFHPSCLLGPVQTSNFSCAESNANELEQKILLICIRFSLRRRQPITTGRFRVTPSGCNAGYIRFGTWKVRRLSWALVFAYVLFCLFFMYEFLSISVGVVLVMVGLTISSLEPEDLSSVLRRPLLSTDEQQVKSPLYSHVIASHCKSSNSSQSEDDSKRFLERWIIRHPLFPTFRVISFWNNTDNQITSCWPVNKGSIHIIILKVTSGLWQVVA